MPLLGAHLTYMQKGHLKIWTHFTCHALLHRGLFYERPINIHTIGTEQTRENDNCCANMHTREGDDLMQETVKAKKCCTNIDGISKSNNRIQPMVKSRLSDITEYFLSGPSYDSDKKRSAETTQQLHKEFEDFNGIGASMAYFHYS